MVVIWLNKVLITLMNKFQVMGVFCKHGNHCEEIESLKMTVILTRSDLQFLGQIVGYGLDLKF